jgi:hypothetical protein
MFSCKHNPLPKEGVPVVWKADAEREAINVVMWLKR